MMQNDIAQEEIRVSRN